MLQVQAENDALRLQEIGDRKKIQHLLNLNHPEEQEITYVKNGRPDTVMVLPRDGGQKECQVAKSGKCGSERVLRTVFLPTANADTLILKVESLQAQLNEQVDK